MSAAQDADDRIIWRSSKAGDIDRHCLAVLCFDESEDRRIYEAGKVAHYIGEVAQNATNKAGAPLNLLEIADISEKAIKSAAANGFEFEGNPEPPPRPDSAIRGRRLAENWLREYPPEPGFLAEAKFTIDRAGRLVEHDAPTAWATGIIDRIGIAAQEDAESVYSALVIGDFKTDWQSGSRKDDEGLPVTLNNTQRRLQAVGGWAMFEDEEFSAIVLELYSLPRLWTYRRRLMMGEMRIIDQWRHELQAIFDGYAERIDKYGRDPEKLASPGIGCKGCPHLGECGPGREHLEKRRGDLSPDTMARAYVAHTSEAWRLGGYLRNLCDEGGPILLDGTEVGFTGKEETVVAPNAAEVVWREWLRQPREGVSDAQSAFERDLLQTYLDGVRLGATALTKLLSKLWPLNKGKRPERDAKREIRTRILDEVTAKRLRPMFGIWPVAEPEPDLEDLLKQSLEDSDDDDS